MIDPEVRAAEKQASREQDAADLASGKKTIEQLRRENTFLSAKNSVIRWDLTIPMRKK